MNCRLISPTPRTDVQASRQELVGAQRLRPELTYRQHRATGHPERSERTPTTDSSVPRQLLDPPLLSRSAASLSGPLPRSARPDSGSDPVAAGSPAAARSSPGARPFSINLPIHAESVTSFFRSGELCRCAALSSGTSTSSSNRGRPASRNRRLPPPRRQDPLLGQPPPTLQQRHGPRREGLDLPPPPAVPARPGRTVTTVIS